MKKSLQFILSLLVLAFNASSGYAQNILSTKDPNGVSLIMSMIDFRGNILPKDTVIEYQSVFANVISGVDSDYVSSKTEKDYQLIWWFKNYYGGYESYNEFTHSEIENMIVTAEYSEYSEGAIGALSINAGGPRAGEFTWYMGMPEEGKAVTGKLQMNREKAYLANATCNGGLKLLAYAPAKFSATIRSGYPYNVSDFQGTVHYKVFDTDSVMVFEKDIKLNASADSAKVEYIQYDDLCEIDSAKEGTYFVSIKADGMEKEMVFPFHVFNPLDDATSSNPVDATYRFKDNDFKSDSHAAWNYTGDARTEYFKNKNLGLISVSTDSVFTNSAFEISQKATRMNPGWYKLKWNGFYRPCDISKIKASYPVLASIYANEKTKSINNILDCASLKVDSGTADLTIPNDTVGAAGFIYTGYTNEISFEVGNDSTIVLGAKATTSDMPFTWTVLGPVSLMYYKDGTPYGTVVFNNDSVMGLKDTLDVTVDLYDGVGMEVPADNTISFVVFKGNEINKDNIVASQEIPAGKAGKYTLKQAITDDGTFKNGEYTVYIGSLYVKEKYLLVESKIFSVDESKVNKVEEVVSNGSPAKGYSYDLNGRRVDISTAPKGVYITDSLKVVKK